MSDMLINRLLTSTSGGAKNMITRLGYCLIYLRDSTTRHLKNEMLSKPFLLFQTFPLHISAVPVIMQTNGSDDALRG